MFQLNFKTCVVNNCSNIEFTETTGLYSVSNLGGYNSPNLGIADITLATLEITSPSNIITTIDMLPLGFPSSNITYSTINISALLGLTNIEDGVWKFKYTVANGNEVPVVPSTTIQTSYFYCNSKCCVEQKLADLQLSECDCCNKDDNYDDYILTKTMLDSLKNAAKCGNLISFTKIKKIIDKLCKNSKCKTCK